jgi:hypothetical protein
MGAPVGRRQPRVAEDVAVRAWHIVRSRLRSLVCRGSRESDLHDELQLHLERETDRLQASGGWRATRATGSAAWCATGDSPRRRC